MGATLCMGGGLAASRPRPPDASSILPPSPDVTARNVSRHCSHVPWLRTPPVSPAVSACPHLLLPRAELAPSQHLEQVEVSSHLSSPEALLFHLEGADLGPGTSHCASVSRSVNEGYTVSTGSMKTKTYRKRLAQCRSCSTHIYFCHAKLGVQQSTKARP